MQSSYSIPVNFHIVFFNIEPAKMILLCNMENASGIQEWCHVSVLAFIYKKILLFPNYYFLKIIISIVLLYLYN